MNRRRSIRAARVPPGQVPVRASGASMVLAVCGFLFLAVIAVFGQTGGHGFVNFDDEDYVYGNQHVRGGLTGAGTAWAITTYHSSNWHPLTWLSHELDCQLYDLKPGGHHLTNVLLHAATAVLLFLALQRMSGALWPSAWAAAVFAIHPLRVESVAWVAERKDVLSGLFFMLTLWFYARYAERPESWGRYLLVAASFAVGLTAKPMLVTLPFVLLLLDYWPLGRSQGAGRGEQGAGSREQGARAGWHAFTPTMYSWSAGRQVSGKQVGRHVRGARGAASFVPLVVEKVPFFVLSAASCLVTLAAQRGAMRSLTQVAFPGRVANAALACVAYLGKMLYPAALAALYPLPKNPPPVWQVVSAVIMLLAISTAVFVVRRRCPYLLFGWLWYLGTLLPVIGLVQAGPQAMADRYTYLTQIGLSVAMAWGAADVARSWPYCRWAVAALAALLMAGLMVSACRQTGYWRDSENLWTHTLACTSQNFIAHVNLGNALAARGQADGAIVQYRKALEIEPDDAVTHFNLGRALAGRGQVGKAIAHFRKALEIKPDIAEAHCGLGCLLAGGGQVDEAIAHFRKALEIKPDDADVHCNLGLALSGSGKIDEAITHFRKALEIKPDSARTNRALAAAIRARIRLHRPVAPAGNGP